MWKWKTSDMVSLAAWRLVATKRLEDYLEDHPMTCKWLICQLVNYSLSPKDRGSLRSYKWVGGNPRFARLPPGP